MKNYSSWRQIRTTWKWTKHSKKEIPIIFHITTLMRIQLHRMKNHSLNYILDTLDTYNFIVKWISVYCMQFGKHAPPTINLQIKNWWMNFFCSTHIFCSKLIDEARVHTGMCLVWMIAHTMLRLSFIIHDTRENKSTSQCRSVISPACIRIHA